MKSIMVMGLCIALGGCVSDDEYNMKGMTYDQKVSYLQYSARLQAQSDAEDQQRQAAAAAQQSANNLDFQISTMNQRIDEMNTAIHTDANGNMQ